MSAHPFGQTAQADFRFWTFTASGRPFDFVDPQPDMIDARALAHQLSGEGRWSNNTFFPLSVAQHSLIVARAMPRPEWRIYGLLHDAAEAFTRDWPTPLKDLALMGAPGYGGGFDIRAVERRILEQAVYPLFELPNPSAEIAQAVDIADARALATEYRDAVQGKGPEWIPPAEPLPGKPIKFRKRDDVEQDMLNAIFAMVRDAHRAGLRRAA
ncbi:hypothetical protein [uncultured Devosia sp.]|uniref:hypothetical protein n=1 Tax=uncultured Devosia sp. TaxID=211434 RepID=UPI0026064956|nr:hypothetical protein [uncultured Devosia sp.]